MTFLITTTSFAYFHHGLNVHTSFAYFHDTFHDTQLFTTFSLQNYWSQFLNYIYTTFSLHFHYIYMSPNHWSQLQTRFSLHFYHIFTTKLLEPIVNFIYTTFSLHFHHINMSPNHWSQLQTRFYYIFTTFSLQNYWSQL